MSGLSRRRRADVSMTDGNIFSIILRFSLPLLLGNLFQQLYNMVDTYVIGQTHVNAAYAAVGSVAPIINILIGFFSGLAAGAGVVISQYFGARDHEKLTKTVHTAMTLTVILCVVFTALGVGLTPTMLRLMLKTDGQNSELFSAAKSYLTIYFAGVSGLLIYNMGAGILRAVGDSARPFYFLLASAVTNTALDFIFVFCFDMGVAGVAYATIIAQFISAILTVAALVTTSSCVRIDIKKLKIDAKIIKIGIPAALQMALTAFSNVFVQSYIANVEAPAGMDADIAKSMYLGAWTTYSKVDQLLFLPLQSLATSVMTFVGQNLGAGNIKRAKRGTFITYLSATCTVIILMIPILIFAPQISSVFNSDADIVKNSAMLLRRMSPFYLFCCINQIFSASLRGAGKSTAPMVIMLSSFVGVRQIYLFVMSGYISNHFLPIALGYPLGWFVCAASTITFFVCCDYSKSTVIKK